MQEIKKSRIVIASVLKPVDDTRMFEKIAATLSARYDVHIVGYPTIKPLPTDNVNIHQHPLKRFTRLSISRLFAPLSILKLIRKLRPQVFIFCTHELLFAAVIARLTGCKVIYDVQENYARNVWHGQTVPRFLKIPLACYIRGKEYCLSPLVHFFFLAERSYVEELTFIGKRYEVLENKLTTEPSNITKRPGTSASSIQLLFSGTLAETTGVFEAIDVAEKLHRHDPRIRLNIVGYAAREEVRRKIRNIAASRNFMTLVGVDSLVPHRIVLNHVSQADFGIISYPDNLSTRSAVPTKLFEYLGHQLPILLTPNPEWQKICQPYPAAITFQHSAFDASALLSEMLSTKFYERSPDHVFWRTEEPKLLKSIETLIEDIQPNYLINRF